MKDFYNSHIGENRYMKKIISVLGVVLIVSLVVFFWRYNTWKNGPLYSLQQVGMAFKEGNNTKLEKYMNLDGLLDKTFSQILINEMRQSGEENDVFVMGMAMMIKSQLVNMAKQFIFSEAHEMLKNNTEGKVKKQFVKSARIAKKEEDIATVEVILNGANGKEIRFLLAMRKMGDYWRVEELLNPEENFARWYQQSKTR